MTCDVTDIDGDGLEERLEEFAALLHACVHAGASVGYVLPFSLDEAAGFWRGGVLPALRRGTRLLLAAGENGRLVGTVQLDCDTPPNQPHRAEARKLLVHPDRRRRGIARLMMTELEGRAIARGWSLITLDTRTGDAAEPLYRSMGYQVAGVIPGYCLDPALGRLDATTIMYKAFFEPGRRAPPT